MQLEISRVCKKYIWFVSNIGKFLEFDYAPLFYSSSYWILKNTALNNELLCNYYVMIFMKVKTFLLPPTAYSVLSVAWYHLHRYIQLVQ